MNNMKKIGLVNIAVAVLLSCTSAFAAEPATITGKVKSMNTHQYLSAGGWDKYTYICLDANSLSTSCSAQTRCGNAATLIISKDGQQKVLAKILAAQSSNSPVTISINEDVVVEGNCSIASVDLNRPSYAETALAHQESLL